VSARSANRRNHIDMKPIFKLFFPLINGLSDQRKIRALNRRLLALHLMIALQLLLGPQLSLAATEHTETQPAWPHEQLTGVWEQYDDDTKQLSSLVRLVQLPDGHFEGMVEKIIPGPGEDPNPRCTKCEGVHKNQLVLGMRIITNLQRTSIARYEKGEILDPDSGDRYQLRITVLDNGQKLDVRGYLGLSLFGRSQIWIRAMNQAGALGNRELKN